MSYTFEEFRRDLAREVMSELPPEDRLRGLPAADRLRGLPAADRLRGLPAAERLRGLPAAERLKGLNESELDQLMALLEERRRSANSADEDPQ